MNKWCLTHGSDLDGLISGYIVKENEPKVEIINFNYGDEIPYDRFSKNDVIYITDLTFDFETFKKLTDNYQIVLIDHHLMSLDIKDNEELKFKDKMIELEQSAVYLTYQYFNPGKEVPLGIKLLSYFDTGKLDMDKKTLPFQFGIQSIYYSKDRDKYLRDMLNCNIDIKEVVNIGKNILGYMDYYIKQNLEHMTKEVDFEGKKCLCLNSIGINSYLMTFLDYKKNPILITYRRGKDSWIIGLYSKSINVGKIAEKRGGGGHFCAASFKCRFLPFNI